VSATEPPSCFTDVCMATRSSVFEGERPVRVAEDAVSREEVVAAKNGRLRALQHARARNRRGELHS
jgi:hypothetical protein